jgi:NADPH2:quinone reductase
MKAVLCKSFGEPESLVMEDIPSPEPGPGEVLVNVHASAVNFTDVLMVAGKYQSLPPFPFSPGGEVAGVVVEAGSDCTKFTAGDRVFGSVGHGGFAEQLAVAEHRLRRIPQAMSFTEASAISTTYGTSYYALKQRANLQPGETLLVLGAGGGVGLSAVELGACMGARVIAAASTSEKLAAAKAAGATELIDYSDGQLKDKVKDLTDGKGVDVIYDPVGGAMFDQCMRSIGWYGRILVIGFAAGDIPKVPINLILLKSCQLIGVFYGAWSAKFPAENHANFDELLALYESEKIKPMIGKRFAFADHALALRCLSERQAIGKVVVEIR